MLQGEHSAILSTFIKLPFVIQIFVLSTFEWPFDTGFTVTASAIMGHFGVVCNMPAYSMEVAGLGPTTSVVPSSDAFYWNC